MGYRIHPRNNNNIKLMSLQGDSVKSDDTNLLIMVKIHKSCYATRNAFLPSCLGQKLLAAEDLAPFLSNFSKRHRILLEVHTYKNRLEFSIIDQQSHRNTIASGI